MDSGKVHRLIMSSEHGILKKKNSWKKEYPIVIEMIKSFAFAGLELTMTASTKREKYHPPAAEEYRLRNNRPLIIILND